MSYRCQPQHDLHVLPHKDPGHGPRGPRDDGESACGADQRDAQGHLRAGGACPSANSWRTRKAIWERLGLPPLKPEPPWHGYDLGFWPEELERQARMATQSDYFALGANLANERRSDVAMNTPVERNAMKEK